MRGTTRPNSAKAWFSCGASAAPNLRTARECRAARYKHLFSLLLAGLIHFPAIYLLLLCRFTFGPLKA